MSPSVAPVRRSGSIARRNASSRAVVTTSSVSQPTLSSLPGNTAATAIARSPSSCARRVELSLTNKHNGLRCQRCTYLHFGNKSDFLKLSKLSGEGAAMTALLFVLVTGVVAIALAVDLAVVISWLRSK